MWATPVPRAGAWRGSGREQDASCPSSGVGGPARSCFSEAGPQETGEKKAAVRGAGKVPNQVPRATQKVTHGCPEKAQRSAPTQQCRAMHGCARPRAGAQGELGEAAAAAAAAGGGGREALASGLGNAGGSSPAASEPLETLLPAETAVQVKTSVEPKERTPQTRPRTETWPLASPGQVFPIPGEEGESLNKDPAPSIYLLSSV